MGGGWETFNSVRLEAKSYPGNSVTEHKLQGYGWHEAEHSLKVSLRGHAFRFLG